MINAETLGIINQTLDLVIIDRARRSGISYMAAHLGITTEFSEIHFQVGITDLIYGVTGGD